MRSVQRQCRAPRLRLRGKLADQAVCPGILDFSATRWEDTEDSSFLRHEVYRPAPRGRSRPWPAWRPRPAGRRRADRTPGAHGAARSDGPPGCDRPRPDRARARLCLHHAVRAGQQRQRPRGQPGLPRALLRGPPHGRPPPRRHRGNAIPDRKPASPPRLSRSRGRRGLRERRRARGGGHTDRRRAGADGRRAVARRAVGAAALSARARWVERPRPIPSARAAHGAPLRRTPPRSPARAAARAPRPWAARRGRRPR